MDECSTASTSNYSTTSLHNSKQFSVRDEDIVINSQNNEEVLSVNGTEKVDNSSVMDNPKSLFSKTADRRYNPRVGLPVLEDPDRSTDWNSGHVDDSHVFENSGTQVLQNTEEHLKVIDGQDDDVQVDLSCGIGRLRTHIFGARFANLYIFAVCFALSNFFTSMVGQVIQVQLTSLERQFNIDNSRAGFLDMASRIGFMSTILFAGHFAKKSHIPLVVGVSGVLQGLMLTIPAVLQFVDPYQLPILPPDMPFNSSNFSDAGDSRKYLCMNNNRTNGTEQITNSTDEVKHLGFVVLLMVQAVKGVTDTFHSGFLPTLYMDDNMIDKSKMGIFLDTEMDPSDERFVSAWWLAFLIFGLGTAVFSLPVMLFPRSLISPRQRRLALDKALTHFSGGEIKSTEIVTENSSNARSNVLRPVLDNADDSLITSNEHEMLLKDQEIPGKESVRDLFKDFPKALLRVLRKPVFVILLLDIVIVSVPVSGISLFRSSYIAYEYNVPMSQVALVTAITTAVGQIVGTVISSWLSSRVTSRMGYLWIISISYFITLAITPLYLVFGCENEFVYGAEGEYGKPVNLTDCVCDSSLQFLSCGDDGNNYVSPCYAGCTDVDGKMFTHCSLLNSTKNHSVAPGLCPTECHDNFIIYSVLHGLQTFFSSLEMVPSRLLILRIVDPEDRGFATSFFMFSLVLVAIPAPNLFGSVIDGTCLIWDNNVCALYDRDKIRYLIAGIDIGVHACVQITCVLMICVMKWEERQANRKDKSDLKTWNVNKSGDSLHH